MSLPHIDPSVLARITGDWDAIGGKPETRSILDLADDLGERAQCRKTIERPQRVETSVQYPGRKDLWPAEVWAEMQRIRDDEAKGGPFPGLTRGLAGSVPLASADQSAGLIPREPERRLSGGELLSAAADHGTAPRSSGGSGTLSGDVG